MRISDWSSDVCSSNLEVDAVAVFLGYDDPAAFRAELLRWLRCVEDRYAHLFEESPTLSAPGSLVFTGGEPDPETLATLASLGIRDGARVWHLVRGWHHGRYRALRSTRRRSPKGRAPGRERGGPAV